MSRCILVAAFSMFLVACVSAPSSSLPLSLLQIEATKSESQSVDPWKSLADDKLCALQAKALMANIDIRQAEKRYQRARILRSIASLDRGPIVNLSLINSVGRAPEGSVLDRGSGLDASIVQDVDLWGRLARLEEVQAAQTEAQRSDYIAARLTIRSQVAEYYWTLAEKAEEARSLAAQREGSAEILELVRLRVDEGKIQPVEAEKSASALQMVVARQSQLEIERAQNLLNLQLILDDPKLEVVDPRQFSSSVVQELVLDSPESLLDRRPDVMRAKSSVDMALAQRQASTAARYPRLSLSANLSGGTIGGQAWDWLHQPLFNLAANLVVPLVDWRRLDLQEETSRSELESAALTLRYTMQKAALEVKQLVAERREIGTQLYSQKVRLAEAVHAEANAKLKLEVGVISRADWLQVRNERYAAEQVNLQLQLRQALNHAALIRAMAVP